MSEYDDLWVKLRFTLETSDYCKKIRGTDLVQAFVPAVCDKCAEKDCKFLNMCVELYAMNMEDHKKENSK